MLTLFEYLRQRAYKAVLTGAQEALEQLDGKQFLDEPPEPPKQLGEITIPDPARGPADVAEESSSPPQPSPAPSPDDEPVPPPRQRGRPRNPSRDSS